MEIQILPTREPDLDIIFQLYDEAIAYQKEVGNNHWLGFSREMIGGEIREGRHFKILGNGEIIATFVITRSDPLIWKDSDKVKAIYLHRIATSRLSRGDHLLKHIVAWAKDYAKPVGVDLIRMDTGAGNDRLIGYYIKNGFTYKGDTGIDYTPDLPAHYENGMFALLEMAV